MSILKLRKDGYIINPNRSTQNYNASTLNQIFNNSATKRSDLLFFHSLDVDSPGHTYTPEMEHQKWTGFCIKDSPFFWCPVKEAEISSGKLKVPLEGISFSAFNSSIHRTSGRRLCCGTGQFGFIAHFPDETYEGPITPMCYFTTDGSSLSRGKCGCGHTPGFQLSSDCSLDSSPINLATCDPSKTGQTLYNEKTTSGKNSPTYDAMNNQKFPYTSLQCSKNLSQFLELSQKIIEIQKTDPADNFNWNEVIIRSWNSNSKQISEDQIPVKALFYTNIQDAANMALLGKLYTNKTGYSIPVVSFDQDSVKDPFKPLPGYWKIEEHNGCKIAVPSSDSRDYSSVLECLSNIR